MRYFIVLPEEEEEEEEEDDDDDDRDGAPASAMEVASYDLSRVIGIFENIKNVGQRAQTRSNDWRDRVGRRRKGAIKKRAGDCIGEMQRGRKEQGKTTFEA